MASDMKRTGKRCAPHIITLSLVFLAEFFCSAKSETGILFHSYDFPPDQRTSLILPAADERAYSFDREFEMSFGVRIDSDKELFGYICRIVLDGSRSIDMIVSNPVNEPTYIAAVTDGQNLEKILSLPPDFDYNDYIPVSIRLSCEGNVVRAGISGAGKEHPIVTSGRRHDLRIAFGANDLGRFSTTDVAPMCIRDLVISADGRKTVFKLENESEIFAGNGSVLNGYWLSENNMSWRETRSFDFDSKVFIVTDPFRYRIYMVGQNVMKEYDFRRDNVLTHEFDEEVDIMKLTNDFFVHSGRQLYYIDMESEGKPQENRFHMHENYWDYPIKRDMHSKYWHHNSFRNPVDSSVVQLFGYGFHQYQNEAVVWKKGKELERFRLDSISPRYLSAVGIAPDSTLLVFGGKGNSSGRQELGVRLYNDLYRVNLRDWSVTRLWDLGDEIQEIAASDLVISPDGTEFLALMYDPNEFNSSLKLTKWSVADGKKTELQSPGIPYQFVDIDSEARLFYDNKRTDAYYAIVSRKISADKYKVLLYRLNSPITGFETETESNMWLWWIAAAAILLSGIGAAVVLWRKGRPKTMTEDEAENILPATEEEDYEPGPGIHILGGFRAIAADGSDISGNFSPLMRQLLSCMILYSGQPSGVSNNELKDVFWYDKSTESYYNNRGVNIKKIRNLLKLIGPIGIVSDNGCWRVEDPQKLCDWNYAGDLLSRPGSLTTEQLLGLARRGTLLPDTSAEWTDRFKARYTERMLDLLRQASEKASPHDIIRLSDAILCFDSLDEDAVRNKCKALIALKRHGTAKKVFRQFTLNYLSIMGEEFKVEFSGFIAS